MFSTFRLPKQSSFSDFFAFLILLSFYIFLHPISFIWIKENTFYLSFNVHFSGILSAYCTGFSIHIWAKAHEMAYNSWMEFSSILLNSLWNITRIFQSRSRSNTVSYSWCSVLFNITHKYSRCWMNESPYTNVLVAPVCLSMLLNLLFLCNIVRVVLLKLRAPASMSNGPNSGPSRNILQAFR